MRAIDKVNEIEIEIEDACRLEDGAIAIYPADQGTAFIGWKLMPDADYAEIHGSEVQPRRAATFLNEDGKCFSGDDEFNFYIEKLAAAR